MVARTAGLVRPRRKVFWLALGNVQGPKTKYYDRQQNDGSTFDRIDVCLGLVFFTRIRHQFIFLPQSISFLPFSTFYSLSHTSLTLLKLMQPSGTVWVDQIRSSHLLGFFRLSSSFFNLP
jgi:hypothetical protein